MNPKIDDTLKALEYEAFMWRGNDVSAVCLDAADLITKLQQELIDERYRHDRYADFCVAQGEELSKLKEQQRWIPVTEKLPEESGKYLIHYLFGTDILWYEVLKTKGKWKTKYKDVTHWMPLPERPKEE